MEYDNEDFNVSMLMYVEEEREKMGLEAFLCNPIRILLLHELYSLLPVKPEVAIIHCAAALEDMKGRWSQEELEASNWKSTTADKFDFTLPHPFNHDLHTKDRYKLNYFSGGTIYRNQWRKVRGSLFQILFVAIISRFYQRSFAQFEDLYNFSMQEYKANIGIDFFNAHPISKIGVHDIAMIYDEARK